MALAIRVETMAGPGIDPARNPTRLSDCGPEIKLSYIFKAYGWQK